MTGEKRARIQVCHMCERRWTQHADVRRWPVCGVDSTELSDERMGAGKPDCPLGKWDGLEPVAEPTEEEKAQRRIERQVNGREGRRIKALLQDEPRDAVQRILERAVLRAGLHPEAAAKLEDEICDGESTAIQTDSRGA